jgi:hypothetical protein
LCSIAAGDARPSLKKGKQLHRGAAVNVNKTRQVHSLSASDARPQLMRKHAPRLAIREMCQHRAAPRDPGPRSNHDSAVSGLSFRSRGFRRRVFTAMRLLLPLKSRTETSFINGLNSGPTGEIRPFVKRHFESFKAAEVENAQSRIWLGIHWQFDADDGREQGRNVANYIMGHALRRV